MNLNDREHATVLAALRYWQREGLMSGGGEHDIASNGDSLEPLTREEIGGLCERLNVNEDAAMPGLLKALDYLLAQTVDMDLKHGIGLTEGETEAREKALAAIAKARGEERNADAHE